MTRLLKIAMFAVTLARLAPVQCQIVQPAATISIAGISNDLGRSYLSSQQAPATSNTTASFVRRNGSELQLDGRTYRFAGMNCYYLLQQAADNSTRHLVTEVFQAAQSLGLTVIRTWAFNDGANASFPLQPLQGQLNATIFSNALDYLVTQASAYGVKLILTLTNYYPDYGGMQQYVAWANATGVVEQFYTDSSIQSMYKDYVTAIVLRKNSLTGIVYRDDPTILAWDLANEPSNYGDDSGDVLQSWLELASSYVKSIDPNHLVYAGLSGIFGVSTPDLLQLNSNYSGYFTPFTSIQWDPACNGNDYARNVATPDIDFASLHLYPMVGPGWTQAVQEGVAAVVNITSSLRKPLVIDEFDVRKPFSQRNEGLELIYGLIQNSSDAVAGSCIWMISSPAYPDYDGFTLYLTENATALPQPVPYYTVPQQAAMNGQNAVFRNFEAALQCVQRRNQQAPTDGSDWPYVDNWNQTLSIIRSAVADVNATT